MGDRPSRQDLLTPELRMASEMLRAARPEADPTSMTAFTADASVELKRAELRHRRSSVDTVIQTKSRIGMP